MNTKGVASLRSAIEQLLLQKSAKENLAIGTYDKTPPTDESKVLKKLKSIDKWFIDAILTIVLEEVEKEVVPGNGYAATDDLISNLKLSFAIQDRLKIQQRNKIKLLKELSK